MWVIHSLAEAAPVSQVVARRMIVVFQSWGHSSFEFQVLTGPTSEVLVGTLVLE